LDDQHIEESDATKENRGHGSGSGERNGYHQIDSDRLLVKYVYKRRGKRGKQGLEYHDWSAKENPISRGKEGKERGVFGVIRKCGLSVNCCHTTKVLS